MSQFQQDTLYLHLHKQSELKMYKEIEDRITTFVNTDQNRRLISGTGTYCMPFRGKIFDSIYSSDVDQHLAKGRKLDILWLGANPNCPQSVHNILNDIPNKTEYESFQHLFKAGYACEIIEKGEEKIMWSPLENVKKAGWVFLKDVLQNVNNGSEMAFCNIVPWGSSDMDKFMRSLENIDAELLARIIRFSDDLTQYIIESLNPEIVLAPKSFCHHPVVRQHIDSPVLGGESYQFEHRWIQPSKSKIHLHIRKDLDKKRLYVQCPHPSAIRIRNEHKHDAKSAMTDILREYLD